jgi:uncharacterized protein
MRIFDPHIHMTSRTTDDYQAMHAAGVRAVVEPAFWLGQPRSSVGSFVDYFDSLLGWERFRAAQFGIAHHCTIALNPKEANDPRCTPVLDLLPRYLAKDGVVAVGEVGFDSMTEAEETAFSRQLELAVESGLPALVHTPHRDKLAGTRRTLDLDTKMDPHRMVAIMQRRGLDRVLVNSAADWGRSDPLTTVRTAEAMLEAGFTDDDVEQVFWTNPVTFFGQSGRLLLEVPEAESAATFEGSSLLRGERP